MPDTHEPRPMNPVLVQTPDAVLREVRVTLIALAELHDETGRQHTATLLTAEANKIKRYLQSIQFITDMEEAGVRG